jgi:hypothetical protein
LPFPSSHRAWRPFPSSTTTGRFPSTTATAPLPFLHHDGTPLSLYHSQSVASDNGR